MKKLTLIIIVLAGVMIPLACSNSNPTGPLATYNLTVTPTNTCTSTPTNWAGYTSTATPLGGYSATPTITFTSTITNTATQTGTLPPTNTFTNTATYTFTATPTNTSTAYSTPTPAPTGSNWTTNAPPNGLAYDGSATVYVAEGEDGYTTGLIQAFNNAGSPVTTWSTVSTSNGATTYTFGQPNGVVYSTFNDYVYVVDQVNNTVYEINPSNWKLVNSPLTTWTAVGGGPSAFSGPQGIAVDTSGNIYIADSNNDYVEEFNPSLTSSLNELSVLSSGTFNNPNALSVDSSGNLWVVDDESNQSGTFNQRVQEFASLSSSTTSSSFTIGGQFPNADICGITVNGGNVYLADSGSAQVEVFSASGTLLTAGLGVSPSNSPSPDGLVFFGSNLLVADYANYQLYLVTP